MIASGIFYLLLNFKVGIKKYGVIIFPIVYFFLVLSFLNSFQIGVRHLLIVLPLLYILIAVLIHKIVLQKFRWIIALLWLFMLVSVSKYYPDIIPYTNELITNKAKVYEKLMDSSIDYGQGGLDAKKFLQNNSDFTTPTATPKEGKYLVGMNEIILQKMQNDTSLNWLIYHYTPIGVVRNVYLKFEVVK